MTAKPNEPHVRQAPSRRRLLLAASAGLAAASCGGGAGDSVAQTLPPSGSSPPGGTGAVAMTTSWASRPEASTATGQAIMVTDVGVNGSVWYSNGVRWLALAAPLTLAHRFSNAQMDASLGVGLDVFLDSCTIPAYVLGPMSGLKITAAYSFPGNGTGGKAPQIRAWFGIGSYARDHIALLDTRGQFTSQKSLLLEVELQNKNSLALNQVRPNDYGGGASRNPFSDASIDFSQAVTIGFGALNDAGAADPNDQQRLEWFSVQLVA